MALPTGKSAVPVVVAVAPDRRRRLSDAALVEASIAARLLGIRILTVNATVALMPADLTAATPSRAAHASTGSSGDSRGRSRASGPRLADAVRNLSEGAELLAEAQRNGS